MAQSRVEMMLKQFDSNWRNDEWAVPLSRALDGVTAREAAWTPPGEGNTIWQTLNHMNFYNERILNRLSGSGSLPEAKNNTSTFGEPGDPNDEAGWQAAIAKAFSIRDGLRETISRLTDDELTKPAGDSKAEDIIPLWLMHDAFHGGQIVLLRKLQNAWPETIWP